jgi:uncharacterized protein
MISVLSNLSAEQFDEKCKTWLERQEALNNLILGIVYGLLQRPAAQRAEHHLWVLEEGGQAAGAALWTPPYKLVLTEMSPGCLEALALGVRKSHPSMPGAVGPKATVEAFARLWGGEGLLSRGPEHSMRLYELRRVEPVPAPPGGMRPAREGELDLLAHWSGELNREANLTESIDERARVEGHFREDRLFVWDDGGPAALAGYGLTPPGGARVYMVYTPPDKRRRGYATALTAALSRKLLDSGRKTCFLYTDLSNPTSNSIYQKIGYRPVRDWDVYAFS